MTIMVKSTRRHKYKLKCLPPSPTERAKHSANSIVDCMLEPQSIAR